MWAGPWLDSGPKSNSRERPGKYCWHQIIWVNLTSDKTHMDLSYALRRCDEKGTSPLWYSFSKSSTSNQSQEKPQTNRNHEHATKCLTSTPQNCHGHGKQRGTRGDQGDRTIKCNQELRLGCGTEKNISGKISETWTKSSVKGGVKMLIYQSNVMTFSFVRYSVVK